MSEIKPSTTDTIQISGENLSSFESGETPRRVHEVIDTEPLAAFEIVTPKEPQTATAIADYLYPLIEKSVKDRLYMSLTTLTGKVGEFVRELRKTKPDIYPYAKKGRQFLYAPEVATQLTARYVLHAPELFSPEVVSAYRAVLENQS